MPQRAEAPVIGRWYLARAERRARLHVVVLSVFAHVLLLGAFVDASGSAPERFELDSFEPVFYLPPPNKPLTPVGSGQRLRYVALGGAGSGSGPAGSPVRLRDGERLALPNSGSVGDHMAVQEAGAPADEEPVYTVVEVHEEAARVANSAAPVYPPQLLAEGIEGTVLVRYVVETTGFADISTLEIISSSRREFAESVRAALPNMRFTPARIDDRAVRQLVEQPFSFRIQRTPTTAAGDSTGSTALR